MQLVKEGVEGRRIPGRSNITEELQEGEVKLVKEGVGSMEGRRIPGVVRRGECTNGRGREQAGFIFFRKIPQAWLLIQPLLLLQTCGSSGPIRDHLFVTCFEQ